MIVAPTTAHQHSYRLVYIHGGTLTARFDNRLIFVPNRHGLWIPTGERYKEILTPGTIVQDISILPFEVPEYLSTTVSVRPSNLALALVDHIADLADLPMERQHAEAVIADLLAPASSAYQLALPIDSRLLPAVENVLRDPVAPHPVSRLAAAAGMRSTEYARLFKADVGISWIRWRFTLRMYYAAGLLNQGVSVGEVAHAVQYKTPSSFGIAFAGFFGDTPSAFKPRMVCKCCGHAKFRRARG